MRTDNFFCTSCGCGPSEDPKTCARCGAKSQEFFEDRDEGMYRYLKFQNLRDRATSPAKTYSEKVIRKLLLLLTKFWPEIMLQRKWDPNT